MLVLSRGHGEKIVIARGGEVLAEVVVVQVRNAKSKTPKVRIGVEAPKDIGVHRLEVWQAIQRGKPQEPAA